MSFKKIPKRGNWYEEEVLFQATGTRFCDDPKDRPRQLMTKDRCIVHTEQLHPKEYASVMSTCITRPQAHPQYEMLKDKVGPRARLLEARLKQQVESEFQSKQSSALVENRRVLYQSQNQQAYDIPSFTPSMRNKDPASIRVPTVNANYATETPISFYSDSVKRCCVNFPTTFSTSSANPFKKSSAFSSDAYTNPTVRRTESNERPRPLPTVREFGALQQLRSRLILHVQALLPNAGLGNAMRAILGCIWMNRDGEESSQIHIKALENCLATDLGFELTNTESNAILSAYDFSSNSCVSLPDLTELLRGTLSLRAAELVDLVLSSLAQAEAIYTEGCVSEEAIRARYTPPSQYGDAGSVETLCSSLKISNGSTSVEDFFEFMTDLRAEVESEAEFENMIRSCWGI